MEMRRILCHKTIFIFHNIILNGNKLSGFWSIKNLVWIQNIEAGF